MVTIKIDEDGNITSQSPKSVKVRILRQVVVKPGAVALEGDVWELSRADAFDLIAVDSAERLTEPGEVEIRREGLEVLAKGPNDPEAKLIRRIPESERKPHPRVEFQPNILIGHLLPSR